jgi:hypothetical protein
VLRYLPASKLLAPTTLLPATIRCILPCGLGRPGRGLSAVPAPALRCGLNHAKHQARDDGGFMVSQTRTANDWEKPNDRASHPEEVTIKVDEWAEKHGIPTRSEAIRRMIDKVLACQASHGRRIRTGTDDARGSRAPA